MNLEYINCELCGQNDFEIILDDCETLSGPLVCCHQCGLFYVNPRTVDFAVSETTTDSSSRRIAVWEKYNQIFGGPLRSDNDEINHYYKNFLLRLKILKKHITTGKLLDIGSGQGHFLNVAQEAGFEVMGLEPNEQTAQIARQMYGVEVITGVLPYPELKNNEFDVVTLLHVLEHLPFPSKELGKVYEILKPNGLLFIEVPNIDTIWFRILKGNWRQLIPDHYFFFTPQTLGNLLEDHGFEVLESSTIGKKMSVGFFLRRVQRYSKWIASLSIRITNKINVTDKNMYLKLGDVIYVVARKV